MYIYTRQYCSVPLPPHCRLLIWVVFWLVERLSGVAISSSGWGLMRVESVTFKSTNLDLVHVCMCMVTCMQEDWVW